MPKSQAQAIDAPNHKTWADYRKGCLMTFRGGYRDSEKLSIFQHGMETIFNLLEAEFPQPKEIFDNKPLHK